MAKGRTNQPLEIVAADQWNAHPAIAALRAAGHRVYGWSEYRGAEPDLILHPAAHGWREEMFVTETKKDGTEYTPYLETAITAARKRKREGAK